MPTFDSRSLWFVGPAEIADEPVQHQALEPRLSFLMLDMLQEVVRSGTAAGARATFHKAR